MQPSKVGSVELLWDVLAAVDVPRLDGEQDRLLRPCAVAVRHQSSQQRRIVRHDARSAPKLDAAAVGVIHQEQERPVVLRQVPGRDVLPVAGEIGEPDRMRIQRADEPFRAAAVLRVRTALRAGRCEVGGVDLREEADQIGIERGTEAAPRVDPCGDLRSVAAGLFGPDGGREGDIGGHGNVSFHRPM